MQNKRSLPIDTAEVRRIVAQQVEEKVAELVTYRAALEAIAYSKHAEMGDLCTWCEGPIRGQWQFDHDPDCPVSLARAALAEEKT